MGAVTIALIQSLKHGLSIYETKLAREYLDRVIFLEKVMYEEENKPEANHNRAVFDNARNELCIIAKNYTSFGKPIASN